MTKTRNIKVAPQVKTRWKRAAIEAIVKHRRKEEITQHAAAANCGWTPARWSNIETGADPHEPTTETLSAMATAVGLELVVPDPYIR